MAPFTNLLMVKPAIELVMNTLVCDICLYWPGIIKACHNELLTARPAITSCFLHVSDEKHAQVNCFCDHTSLSSTKPVS